VSDFRSVRHSSTNRCLILGECRISILETGGFDYRSAMRAGPFLAQICARGADRRPRVSSTARSTAERTWFTRNGSPLVRICASFRVYLLLAPLFERARSVVDGGEQNPAVASFDGQTKGRAGRRIYLELADKLTCRPEFHD